MKNLGTDSKEEASGSLLKKDLWCSIEFVKLDGREKHVNVFQVQQNETKDLYLKWVY